MAYQECENGHIYDTDIYPRCPYCRNTVGRATGLNYGATVMPQGFGNQPGGGLDYGATVMPQGFGNQQGGGLDYGATVMPQGFGNQQDGGLDFGSTVMPQGFGNQQDGGLDFGSTVMPQESQPLEGLEAEANTAEPLTEAEWDFGLSGGAPEPKEEPQAPAAVQAPAAEQGPVEAPVTPPPAAQQPVTAQAPVSAPKQEETAPIVGWLVCVEGPEKGKDFRVYQKLNMIGKSERAGIRLRDEAGLPFPIWARLAYSTDDNRCRISAISAGHVLHNGKEIEEAVALSSGDRLVLGGCEYIFVALCGDSFRWDAPAEA